nr:hypothetical protein [Pseudomonadota bacterium]
QLVADPSVRKIWDDPNLKEPAFEKLGGAHLLLHKIWGFKINAVGERTDLVFADKLSTESDLYNSVDGLVLTEWKVIRSLAQTEKIIKEAKNQAEKYTKGSLAAIELSNYRYLVIVSEKRLPEDGEKIIEGDVTYKIINIAYNPDPPSKS